VRDNSQRTDQARRRAGFGLALGLLLLAAIAVAAVVLALRFVAAERERDMTAWQVRMGIVADSRAAAVETWLQSQFAELKALADNPSVQIYVAQLVSGRAQPGEVDEDTGLPEPPAEAQYLMNLLIVTAERAGYEMPPASEVGANLPNSRPSGLALIDPKGAILVATAGMPPLEGRLGSFVRALQPTGRALLDLYLDQTDAPAMGFAQPIYAVQGDVTAASLIGYVLGVKQVAGELYPLLRQPGDTTASGAVELLRANAGVIDYLTPLADGTPPLGLRLNRDTPDLDAAFALEHEVGFGLARDYRGHEVLVTSRRIADAPWTLAYTIDRDEALGASEERAGRLLTIMLLVVGLFAVIVVTAWLYGSSRRAAEAAERLRTTAENLETQRRLLQLVTDSQPTDITIIDAGGRFRFANRPAAKKLGLEPEDFVGRPAAGVLGPAAAKLALTQAELTLARSQPTREIRREPWELGERIIQVTQVPMGGLEGEGPAVLSVEEDLTDVFREREHRLRLEHQLVQTLLGVVDRRDPFAAEHSNRVARLAQAVAAEMGLSEIEINTAETAGLLLNLGKILVEPELLTRSASLNEDERQQVRRAMLASADLLSGVEFEGPVVETIRQSLARWDGAGLPPGLAGEQILPSARVVALANAAVGMLSPRAHRGALGLDAVIAAIQAEADRSFDRRAVAAFVHYLDNRGGRRDWQTIAESTA
jgi:PAS domain S-box-containing protein